MVAWWCPVAVLAAAFLLLAVAESPTRTKRLTTFGKTPNSEPEHKIPRGKLCQTDQDCDWLESTTCTEDTKTDNKRRCLCHNLEPPNNGVCVAKPRDVRGYVPIAHRRTQKDLQARCTHDNECTQGAECIVNSTIVDNHKRCYCRPGYEKEGNECSSGAVVRGVVALLLFTTLALLTTQRNF